MKAVRLPKDPGITGWNAILPAATEPRLLETEIESDWLIIGAGWAGLAAAARLKELRPADSITVLDAVRIGEGPAGRNSGFMIDLPHDLASEEYSGSIAADLDQISMNRAAIDFAASLARRYGLSEEAFSRPGKINAAATASGLRQNQSYAEHLSKLNEPYEQMNADAMASLTGTKYYRGGLFTPGSALVQPAMFIRGLAKSLDKDGIALFENTPVLAIKNSGQWLAQTPNGSVRAAKVILAVNGHTESFGLYKNKLIHVFTYASMTRTLSTAECERLGGASEWGLTPADPLGTTVRRISGVGGDRIVIRNRFTCDPSMEVTPSRIAKVGRSHSRAFAARFPMLEGVDMEHCWGGRLCLSRNSAPAFGTAAPGLVVAACQNGLGLAKGTLAGKLAAELVVGEESDMLNKMLSQPAPLRLPPRLLTWLGANARIKWGEHRAGAEL